MTELVLIADTETTGFPKKGNLIQDGQARVCQVGLILADMQGMPRLKFSALIKPDGWSISEGAQKVHGLSTEQCDQYGLHFRSVFALYARLASMASLIVAHNSDFDKQMMEIEQAHYNAIPMANEDANQKVPLEVSKQWFCTMKSNTHISGGKWPKLAEALKHFCNRDIGVKAHDALVDAEACMEIYFAMKEKKQ